MQKFFRVSRTKYWEIWLMSNGISGIKIDRSMITGNIKNIQKNLSTIEDCREK